MHLTTSVFCIITQSFSSYGSRLNVSRSTFKKEYYYFLYYKLFIDIQLLSVIEFAIKYQFITY